MSEPKVLFISSDTGNPFYSDGTYGIRRKSLWKIEYGKVILRPFTDHLMKPRLASKSCQDTYQLYLANLVTEAIGEALGDE